MRTLLLASACFVVMAGPASERVEVLMIKLSQGQLMHKEGHRQGDMGKLLTSLRILDELKEAIAPWQYDFGAPDRS